MLGVKWHHGQIHWEYTNLKFFSVGLLEDFTILIWTVNFQECNIASSASQTYVTPAFFGFSYEDFPMKYYLRKTNIYEI